MLNFTCDNFLDMTNLVIRDEFPKPLTKDIVMDVVKRLIVNIQEYMKIEPMFDTEENRFFIEMLQELINLELTESDKSRLIVNSSKWIKKFPKGEDQAVKRVLTSILLCEEKIDDKHISIIFKKLKLILMWCISDKELKSVSYKMKKINNTTDMLTQEVLFKDIFDQARSIIEEVKIIGAVNQMDIITVDHINLSDANSIKKALNAHRLTRESVIFKTGLQGINDMLGEKGGFTLGELVCFAALSHNYKSGMLMDCARWMVSYNHPPQLDSKIPVVLFISLENEATNNLINWYKRGHFIHKNEPPPPHFTDDDMAEFITQVYAQNGWELHIVRKLGELFGFEDYLKVIEDYKRAGRRVYISIIDYPAKMKLGFKGSGDSSAMKSAMLQDLYSKFLNHAKHEHILTIGAHQLGPDAAAIAAQVSFSPIKKFQGGYHMADSKGVYKELDCCILLHKEYNTNKQPFLTGMWSKHRDNDPPEVDKQYFAYPFSKYGIIDDIHLSPSQSVADIYSYRLGDPPEIEDLSIFN